MRMYEPGAPANTSVVDEPPAESAAKKASVKRCRQAGSWLLTASLKTFPNRSAPSSMAGRRTKRLPMTCQLRALCCMIADVAEATTAGFPRRPSIWPTTQNSGTKRWMRGSMASSARTSSVPSTKPGPSWHHTSTMRRCVAQPERAAAKTARLPPLEWPPTRSGPRTERRTASR